MFSLYKQFIPTQKSDPPWAQRRFFVSRITNTDNTGSFKDLELAKKEKFILDEESDRKHIIISESNIVYSPGIVSTKVITDNNIKDENFQYDTEQNVYKNLIKDIKEEITLQKEKIKITQKQISEVIEILKNLDKLIKKETDPKILKHLISKKQFYDEDLLLLNQQLVKQQLRLTELENKDPKPLQK